MLSSSSVSVADAYTIWTDVNEINGVSTYSHSNNYKIKLSDSTAASTDKKFTGFPTSYSVNLLDGITSIVSDDAYTKGKPIQINLFDGILSVLNNNNKQIDNAQDNIKEKTFSVNISDGEFRLLLGIIP